MWCDKCFCLPGSIGEGCCGARTRGRSLAAARVADSNAIAARLQGPVLGVSLDALSLEVAEATRRDACEKSGFESSVRRAYAGKKSSGAVPVLVFGQLVALFLFVVVPLTYLGAAAGFSKETIEWPARASKIERPIPPQPATLSLPVSALLLWSAFARRGLRRAAGGPLLRLHVTCIVGGGARRGRGGLPRVAQVPRVHLRADQVRLGRRVPFPLPRPCKRGFPTRRSGRPRPLPRRRRGVVFGTAPVFADGYQRNAGLKFNSLVSYGR